MAKRIGLLTGGGDAPGLNGVIESVVKTLHHHHVEVVGIKNGFEGIFLNNTTILTPESTSHVHSFAGTILGSSNKSTVTGREAQLIAQYKKLNLDGLIACGGDGTFKALKDVSNEIKIIGVPKTIDNDLHGTDVTFGFDTACTVVSESVDSLRYTAEAHERIIVVETMGRTAGWMALCGGLSAYSDVILIPERPYDKQNLLSYIRQKKTEGRKSLMVVVSEGAHEKDHAEVVSFKAENSPEKNRLGGIGFYLSRLIEQELNWESRHVVLGHLQRSRQPSHFDRLLTLQLGVKAAHLVLNQQWNQAASYRQGQVTSVALDELMQGPRNVDAQNIYIKNAEELGVFI